MYYNSEKVGSNTDSNATPQTTAQLKSWGAAYQLGGGDGVKALGDLKTWRKAADGSENGGFPVLVKPGATGDAAHMQPASSWSDVGAWVDAFATTKKPTGSGAATGSGATGPYQIATPEAFAWFAYKVNSGTLAAANQNATLTADIDLSGNQFTGASGTGTDFANCLSWVPIGGTNADGSTDNSINNAAQAYRGSFDGQKHQVSNLRVKERPFKSGLFGFAANGAKISNVSVASGYVLGIDRVAGVLAQSLGAVTVEGCSNAATVVSRTPVAGVSGVACNAAGVVGCALQTGGLVVRGCSNTGAVSSGREAGGVFGNANSLDVTVENSFNAGAVHCSAIAGGIASVGDAKLVIRNCYNAGKVSGRGGSVSGSSGATVTNSYYDTNVGSVANVVKGTGLTTAQMQTRGFALNLNNNKSGAGTAWTWTSGYPTFGEMAEVTWMDIGQAIAKDEGTFASFKPATGDGTTEATATQIATPEGLAWYSYQASESAAPAFAKLTSDLDLAGLSYVGKEDAGTGEGHANCLEWAFLSIITGTFDGGGHTLKNMRGGAFCGGLNNGTIKGVNIADSTFEAAAIAVMTMGNASVVRCSAAADVKVSGSGDLGGLVVQMDGGTLEDCWSRAAVESTSGAAGGLVGSIESGCTVKNCYSAPASLTGTTSSGALIGRQRTASSTIGVTNCYYPQSMNAAGTGTVTGATSMTEARMRTPLLAFNLNTPRTGADAPWTWNLLVNNGYPSFGVPPADEDVSTWAGIARLLDEGQLRRIEAAIDANGFGTLGTVHDAAPATGEAWLPALSGTGAADDVFVIRTPEALAWFALKVNDNTLAAANQNAQLAANIDLAGFAYTGATEVGADFANCLEWIPVGNGQATTLAYQGTFSGQGKTVANLRSTSTSSSAVRGLFGSVKDGGLSGIVLSGGYVSTAGLVGGLVGMHLSNAFVEDCTVDVDVVGGNDCVGGIVGGVYLNAGQIRRCANLGDVSATGATDAGGILGGTSAPGVLVIEDCYNTGAVKSAGQDAAGIFGRSSRDIGSGSVAIKNCYNAGTVTGYRLANSIGKARSRVTLTNCYYDKAKFADASAVAGTMALTTSQLQSWGAAYALNGGDGVKALGDLKVWRAAADGNDNGGFPVLVAAGATGDAAHMTPATDWSDVGAWVDVFAPAKKPTGDGAAATPFQIGTPEALAWFALKVNDATLAAANQNAQLAANIDLAGFAYTGATEVGARNANCLAWTPIGTTDMRAAAVYNATFSGGGNTVANMRIETGVQGAYGLFGCVGMATSISDLTLRNIDIAWEHTGSEFYAAPLVGAGTRGLRVERCGVSSGTVAPKAGASMSGTSLRGISGLVGNVALNASATRDALISDCFVALDAIDAGTAAGKWQRACGMVARNEVEGGFSIANSYVSADTKMVAGAASAELGRFSAGFKIAFSNCFFNKDKSGELNSEEVGITGLTGVTSAQLQSWGAAYQLNGGDGVKALADLKTWRKAADASDNSGYPILVKSGATGDAAHMQPAASWGDVGAWVDAFAPAKKPTGDGAAATPFEIGTPEALAWFAHQVNDATLAVANHNVKLTANIDLLGAAYSGKSGTAAADSLAWSPIGKKETGKKFAGSIDGGRHMIDHLYVNLPSDEYVGLVGWADSVSIDCLGIGANSSVTGRANAAAFVGACLAARDACRITNCWNRAQVTVAVHTGAFLGDDSGAYSGATAAFIENCYNAGDATFGDVSNGTIRNCYADTERYADAALGYNNFASAVGVSTAQLQSWGAAYALNGGDGTQAKNPTTLTTWRKAADASDNGGYPVFVKPGATGDAAHMQPAADWGEVGLWVVKLSRITPPGGDGMATGSGSTGPLRIGNAEQLAWFAYMVNEGLYNPGRQYARLTADIDLSGFAYTGATDTGDGFANCLKWVPIAGGSSGKVYSDTFDGQGFGISNLRVESDTTKVGLIGAAEGATVQNTGVNSGKVVGAGYVGGLVGNAAGISKFYDCYNAADIERTGTGDTQHAGGITGGNEVAANASVYLDIKRCWNTGSVTSTSNSSADTAMAGIAGWIPGHSTIYDCYNTGTITGGRYTAGIVGGGGTGASSEFADVYNCYNTGVASGGTQQTGAISTWKIQLYNCYTLPGTVEKCYSVTGAPVALTADQLASWGAAYALNGGDGTQAKNPTTLTTWRKAADASDNGGFPVLVATGATGDAAHMQPAASWGDVGAWVDAFAPAKQPAATSLTWRDGTSAATGYKIDTPEELAWFAYKVNQTGANVLPVASQNVALEADIDLSGYVYTGKDSAAGVGDNHVNCLEWSPIGNGGQSGSPDKAFCGHFDGRGYAVGNLRLKARGTSGQDVDVSGLFGRTYGGAVIERIGISSGTLDVSNATNNNVATLVGWATENATVRDCYSVADVTPISSGAGGLTGYLDRTTYENCYYAGNLGRFWAYCEAGEPSVQLKNCMLVGSQRDDYNNKDVPAANLRGLTADELKSWGAAYQLNAPVNADGTQKALADLKTWRIAADANENGGYPTFIKEGDIVASMTAAHDWADVGAWVDAFAADKKPAEADAPASWNAAAGTKAYSLDTVEKLAWLAYKVNTDSANYTAKNAVLAADLDLFGSTYTGRAFDSAADLNTELEGKALPWVAIGGSATSFGGAFDGQLHTLRSVYINEPAKDDQGFFGAASAALVSGVRIEASFITGKDKVGAVVGYYSYDYSNHSANQLMKCSVGSDVTVAGGAQVGGVVGYATGNNDKSAPAVADCYSRAAVSGTTQVGGVIGLLDYGRLDSCYYAGTTLSGTSKVGAVVGETNDFGLNTSYYDRSLHALPGVGAGGDTGVTGMTTQEITAGNGAVLAGLLNASRTGEAAPWRGDSKHVNNGYAVLVLPGTMPADWSAVGAAQTEDALRLTEALIDANGFGTTGTVQATAPATPALSGTGAADDPYIIRTPEAFAWFASKVNDSTLAAANQNAQLGASIDLAGFAYTGATEVGASFANCLEWIPVGNGSATTLTYQGTFSGQGKTVANLRSTSTVSGAARGLFGSVKGGGVSNLVLSGGYVSTPGAAGGLVGMHLSNATVEDCTVDVDVVGGNDCVGGVVCAVYPDAGQVRRCANLGDVSSTGSTSTAGIVGGASVTGSLTIEDCYNTGAVSAAGRNAAGIYGRGTVTSGAGTVAIKNCYNAGAITGATLANSIAKVQNRITLTNCYYDKAKCADASVEVGTTPVTSGELQSWGAAYQLNGGDGVKALGDLKTWRKAANGSENGGFPVLVRPGATGDAAHMQPAASWDEVGAWLDVFGAGQKPTATSLAWRDGTSAATGYELGTPAQLAWFAYKVNQGLAAENHNVALTADIDLSGRAFTGATELGTDYANCLEWKPIGRASQRFVGRFDGRGHAVENLRMTVTYGNQRAGLFGEITKTSVVVERLGIASGALDMQSYSTYVATFVAIGYGSFLDCYSLADVVGPEASWEEVGGFTGSSTSYARFVNCYYGGNYDKFWGKWEQDHADMVKNCFKLGSTQTQASSTVRGLTADQLASWGTAYQLNAPVNADGTQKALGDLTTWRKAADASDNGGFPVLVAAGATGDAAHMQPASDWSDVGAWVDAFATGKKPTGDGAASSFQIGSPEALAWFAYKVNQGEANGGLAGANQNAALTTDIDLAGWAYTGNDPAAGAGESHVNCLKWTPVGIQAEGGIAERTFRGSFDGRGHAVGSLRLVSDGKPRGLFGHTSGSASIERLGISSGTLASTDASHHHSATFVGWHEAGTVRDCYSVADVVGSTNSTYSPGGFTGYLDYGAFENCYYAGNLGKFWGITETGRPNVQLKNCMLVGSQRDDYHNEDVLATNLRGLTSDQLKSWGAAYALGGGDGTQAKNPTTLTTWRKAADASDNKGFPVLVAAGATGDAAHLQPAADWSDVGAWVDAFAPDKKPAVGDGSSAAPWQLDTPEHLAWFGHLVNGSTDSVPTRDKCAVLGNNLEMTGFVYTGQTEVGTNYANCLPWAEICPLYGPIEYNGTFDGAGHTLSNLVGQGLFGWSNGATFKDVGFAASAINSTSFAVGALVGEAANGTIARCWVAADVSVATTNTGSGTEVGGLAGNINRRFTMSDCYSRATVSGAEYTGGLLGAIKSSTVNNCYSAATSLSGTGKVGLFVGYVSDGTATNCFYQETTGSIAVGEGTLDGLASKTAVELAAERMAYDLNAGRKGEDAPWTQAADVNAGYPRLGDPPIDTIIENWGDVGEVQVEATLRLTEAVIDANGFGTTGTVQTTAPATPALSGDGTAASPYVIRTPEAFAWWGYQVNQSALAAANQNAKLAANIDLAGFAYTGATEVGASFANCLKWVPIGGGNGTNSTPTAVLAYEGAFDGQGHKVTNLTVVPRKFYSGLFGVVKDTTISNVHVASGYVAGVDRVGAVVGNTVGTTVVEDCSNGAEIYADPSVAGGTACNTAGVVGCGYYGVSLTIKRCFNTGKVRAVRSAAGVVDGHAQVVEDCYNTGEVSRTGTTSGYYVSGIANMTNAVRCYNTGNVSGSGNYAIGPTATGSFYLEGITGAGNGQGTQVTADQLKSWGAAYQLNAPVNADGTQKALGDLTTWRVAADASDNGGYPVLVRPGATGDAAHMQPASDWSDVGAWVDAFATGKQPTGDGAAATPYEIGSPEALAWFAYKVNQGEANGGLATANHNVKLTADIDLAGWAYTGNAVGTPGTNYENCLRWRPIGAGEYAYYGHFDGCSHVIHNLHLIYDEANRTAAESIGFFGDSMLSGGIAVERLGLASGALDVQAANAAHDPVWIGTFVGYISGQIVDCYSSVDVVGAKASDSGNGGFVGVISAATRFTNCYYAGNKGKFWGWWEDGLGSEIDNCYVLGPTQVNEAKDLVTPTGQDVIGLTQTQLRSWKSAYNLNGKSYVGKPVSGGAVASTVWTNNPQKADGTWTYGNDGYPVFGNLELEKLSVTVDPNDVLLPAAAGSSDPAKKVAGAITTPLLVAHPLSGPVKLLEAPSAPAGVTLSAAADVDAGFSTWGTDSANAKVALVAGTTSLVAGTAAGTVLSTGNLASIDVHAAAAYSASDARAVKLAVMDATGGYEVTVNLKAVTSKTLDVTAPVEAGASFELSPDGKLHENVMAKEASTLKSNNSVPLSGYVSSVAPLTKNSTIAYPDGSSKQISEELVPVATRLAATSDPITDAGKVRLFAGASTGSGDTAGLTSLASTLYYDPAKSTVPLAFSVPGSGEVIWKWGMDYTGTYLEPDGVFGYSTGYTFNLPSADVTSAQLSEKA